jgi:hypothetical protein
LAAKRLEVLVQAVPAAQRIALLRIPEVPAPPIAPDHLIIDGGIDLGTVQHEECLHGGMADALVAVNERMALDRAMHSAAAFSTSVGYKSTPPKLALRCAIADSSAPRSRIPEAPPVANEVMLAGE